MSRFTVKARPNSKRQNPTFIVTIPKDLIELYSINEGDILELDLVRNHRDRDNK